MGCSRGLQPHPSPSPSWLPTLQPQPAPTRQLLAFQDFELGRQPARFISEGAENGKRWRSKRLSQCPTQAGMDPIFQIKTQLARTQACRESLPSGAAGEGWVCKTEVGVGEGRLWGPVALQSLSPEGLLSDPHPTF